MSITKDPRKRMGLEDEDNPVMFSGSASGSSCMGVEISLEYDHMNDEVTTHDMKRRKAIN